MPRKPRLHVDGGSYHVIMRGNHRQPIFHHPADRDLFASLVSEALDRFDMRVHAYCWMTNHVHLLMQVGETPLGRAMMCIASRYARHKQRQEPTTGHFFERRYRALLIDANAYFLELVRYIHLNPVRAGLVTDPARYTWCGHAAYLGLHRAPWLTTEFVLNIFGNELRAARRAYQQFVQSGMAVVSDGGKDDDTFVRGSVEDSRVLGSDAFLRTLPQPLPRKVDISLDEVIASVCAIYGADRASLGAPGRSRRLAHIRAIVVYHAARLKVATLSEVARTFNRSASTLSETLEYLRRTQPSLLEAPLDLP
ncbi:MAG: transposase [Anaerolineae bacterium]|nr:transposase [Anaerolineae bacterium]